MIEDIIKSFKLFIICTFLIAILYNLSLYLTGSIFFPHTSKGSLIIEDGSIKGSYLLGQDFKSPKLFHTRQNVNSNFEASTPIYDEELIFDLRNNLRKLNKELDTEVPYEMIAFSSSNLDPFISVRAAKAQIERISKETNIPSNKLISLIDNIKETTFLPFFIIEKVNVTKLNFELIKLLR
jgi:K+-transporting ATPase ATPase C chain